MGFDEGERPKKMEFDGFDWDEANESKCKKHGVPLAEIEDLFRGTPLVLSKEVDSLARSTP